MARCQCEWFGTGRHRQLKRRRINDWKILGKGETWEKAFASAKRERRKR